LPSIIYLGCPAAERADTERALASASLTVVWADTVALAQTELQRSEMPVLLDLSRGVAAIQGARELRQHHAAALLFAVVDARRPDLTTEAVLAGIADIFPRPLNGRRVANGIERERSYDARPPAPGRTARTNGDLYCHSHAMQELSAEILRAGATRTGVLIRGERGTGRQLVARSIHASQATAPAPFMTLDCAAHDGDALDVELFGTPTGSRNGTGGHEVEAVTRKSLLYRANNGTLYLQHIAEAPTRVQARLARALRDGEAVLADTNEAIALDVRPMASADSGIDSSVQEGRVREDLFRRLAVARIDVPPLRNRRDDLPALANYFVRAACAELGVPPKTLSRPALSLLVALPWRGNAIELRSLVATVVNSLGGGRGIGLDDLLSHISLDGGGVVLSKSGTLRQARARFEREYIAAVLERHQGRMSDAARALGIQRTNLYRKIRSLKLPRGRKRSTSAENQFGSEL
jgi:two-component system nitrogen regulation response regulator GlnG